MSLHFANPADEPRDCFLCDGSGESGRSGNRIIGCSPCKSTGRLGNPDAKPDISVFFSARNNGWCWRRTRDDQGIFAHGPFDTEAKALAAARKAMGQS